MKTKPLLFLSLILLIISSIVLFIRSSRVVQNTNAIHHENSSTLIKPDEQVDLTNNERVTVKMNGYKYSPMNIKVKVGTTVIWVNDDEMKHNVMLEHEHSETPHDAPTIGEIDPNKLAGPMLTKGESYSFTFREISHNHYHCSPHPWMKGIVEVVE